MDRNNAAETIQEGNAHQGNPADPALNPPYRIVREAVFSNLKKEELIDTPHSARLQYRLMLLDPIIKAAVDFADSKITIIYNPRTASNIRDKISLEEIVQILAKEGVNADRESTEDRDYDYLKEMYSYAHSPLNVRETPPYGYTVEEWKKMKLAWVQKMARAEMKKKENFLKWQERYLNAHPDIASKVKEE